MSIIRPTPPGVALQFGMVVLVATGSMAFLGPGVRPAEPSSPLENFSAPEEEGPRMIDGGSYAYECPSPGATLRLSEPPWYVGQSIDFDLAPSPCLDSWTIDYGDGSAPSDPGGNRASHAYDRRGSYEVQATAHFPQGVFVTFRSTLFVNCYPAPDVQANPERTHVYREAPRFPTANLTHMWYLDNGLDWYNRPYSQLSFGLWLKGLRNATYTHGQGGVTLHVLSLYDGSPLAYYTPYAKATIVKLSDDPANQVPPCKSGYSADMPSYSVTDLGPMFPSGWGFRSQVMGCGHEVFQPGKTLVTFCIEWDGEIAPPLTPYKDGYLEDSCDVRETHQI